MTATLCSICAGRGYVLTDEDVEPCPACSGEPEANEPEPDETVAKEIGAGSFLGRGNEVPW